MSEKSRITQTKSQTVKDRFKKTVTETSQFVKRHPIATILLVVFIIGGPIFVGIGMLISFVIINNAETLKTLIEAEATVLGFFGFIAVYALGSLDNRIDRLEQEIGDMKLEDLKKGNNKLENSTVCKSLCDRKLKIEEAKKRFGDIAIWAGLILITSLATSIVGMGFANLPDYIPNKLDVAFTLATFSVLSFFGGTGLILSMIHDSARKTEEVYDINLPA